MSQRERDQLNLEYLKANEDGITQWVIDELIEELELKMLCDSFGV